MKMSDLLGGSQETKTAATPTINHDYKILCDIYEDDTKFIVLADCPGLSIDSIKLKWSGDNLKLKLEPNDDEVHGENIYELQRERLSDEAERIISFSQPVSKQTVNAEISDGVLRIEVDKVLDDDDDNDCILISRKK